MKSRATWLLVFLASLHLLVLTSIWTGSLGRIAAGVMLVSAVPVTLALTYLVRRTYTRLSWLDVAILVYAGWSIASLILFLQPGNPSRIGAYAFGVYHFVLPIACYFAAKSIAPAERQRLIDGLLVLNTFALTYGMYLYFTRPAFYLNYLTDRLSASGELQEWQYFARLQSYLGSTSVGYLAGVSVVLVTIASPALRRLLPLLVPVFVAAAALSLQRASLIGVALALLYLVTLTRVRFYVRVLVMASMAATVVYGLVRLESSFRERLQSRATTEMVEGAEGFFAERGYRYGLMYLKDFPLGVGVGATSSAAANAGLLSRIEVADANFMRIAADLGPQGLLMFLGVLVTAALRATRKERRFAWLTILTVHCGIMLTTNVFDSFYVSHAFWTVLAVLDGDAESPGLARPADAPQLPPASAVPA